MKYYTPSEVERFRPADPEPEEEPTVREEFLNIKCSYCNKFMHCNLFIDGKKAGIYDRAMDEAKTSHSVCDLCAEDLKRSLNLGTYTFTSLLADLKQGIIPEKFPYTDGDLETRIQNFQYREVVTQQYGLWTCLDKEWSGRLASLIGKRRVLEVMGGRGWLAKALSDWGVDIICTDNFSSHKPDVVSTVFDVEHAEAVEAVEMYRNSVDIILCSWPPYQDEAMRRVGEAWVNKPMIYIGEDWGGCCATDGFFEGWNVQEEIDIPQWDGIHDVIQFGYWRKD